MGLGALSLAIIGVVVLIFEVVRGDAAGWTAGALVTALLAVLWLGIPLAVRDRDSAGAEDTPVP